MSTAGTINEAVVGVSGVRHGHLRRTSATALQFIPWGGDRIKINGTWRTIPAAGVTIGNGGLAANTNYFVYLYWDGSALVPEFSATGHSLSSSADNAGVEIKTGDESRSLIGYIRTDASSQFTDAENQRWVRSWFNRFLDKRGLNFTGATASTVSGAWVPMSATWKLEFLSWANEVVTCTLLCSAWQNNPGYTSYIALRWDDLTFGTPGVGNAYAIFSDAGSNWHNIGYTDSESFSTDGYHFVVPHFSVSGGGLFVGVSPAPFVQLNGRIG